MRSQKFSAVKQKKFAREYFKDFDGRRAAKVAGVKDGPGLDAQVSRLLSSSKVREELQRLQEKHRETSEITIKRIERELAAIAFSRTTDVVGFNAKGVTFQKSSNKLADAVKSAIQSVERVETKTGSRTKVTMHDKKGALELLGRQRGMFNKDQSGPVEKVVLIIKE